MGELFEKHNAGVQKARENAPQTKKPVANARGPRNGANISADEARKPAAAAPARKGRKPRYEDLKRDHQLTDMRRSHEGMYHDKENAPAGEPLDTLKNPKRRANAAAAGPSRVVSQDVGANSRVLSPKSLNSRTYPHSPLRGSPDKFQRQGHFSRPVSPVKASSPLRETDNAPVRTIKTAASTTKGTKAPTKKPVGRPAAAGKTTTRSPGPRPATRQGERKLSTSTVSSAASSGTTVVKGTRTAPTGARKPTASSNAAAKKTAATRNPVPAAKRTAAAAPAPATGKRTLRKRV